MTAAEARMMMIEHLQGQFPKTCTQCRRDFATLQEFYLHTKPVGTPIAHDLEADVLRPLRPLGAVAVSQCGCGALLAITSDGMPVFRLWSLLLWAKYETLRRGISSKQLLQELRVDIRKQVLAGAGRPQK